MESTADLGLVLEAPTLVLARPMSELAVLLMLVGLEECRWRDW